MAINKVPTAGTACGPGVLRLTRSRSAFRRAGLHGPAARRRPGHTCLMWLVWSLTVAGDNAVASGLPSAVCADSICSPAQEEVWRGFQNSGGLDSPLPVPSVFSGVCYHHNPYLDPNQVHYGAVLIDDLDGRVLLEPPVR